MESSDVSLFEIIPLSCVFEILTQSNPTPEFL